jgi:signal transduction histidine kinase
MCVRVSQILHDALSLTESQLKKNGIEIRQELSQDLPPVLAHAQQIQQVFLNVINNARYALNKKYPQADADKIFLISGEQETIKGNDFVRITFEDHGTGIPAEILERVMTPFFTTKPAGIGTGLGLSISHGILVDHHGKIEIQSMDGKYTRVSIFLPVYEGKA